MIARTMILVAMTLPLAACLGGGTVGQAPALAPEAASAAAAEVDAVFAAKGCSIPATQLDAALAAGPDASRANAWLARALAREELSLTLSRPVSIVTSHRGVCA